MQNILAFTISIKVLKMLFNYSIDILFLKIYNIGVHMKCIICMVSQWYVQTADLEDFTKHNNKSQLKIV
jgi:hypothetical protein